MNEKDISAKHLLDKMMQPQMRHYMSFYLKELVKAANFQLKSINLIKKKMCLEGEVCEVPIASVESVSLSTGAVSYIDIYPRYLPNEINDSILGQYDDIIVRFSIKLDGISFYTPTWESVIRGDTIYEPKDVRFDWDKLMIDGVTHGYTKNTAIRKAREAKFKESTESVDGFMKALAPFLSYWLNYHTVHHNE